MAKINNVRAFKLINSWMNSLDSQGGFTKTLADVEKEVGMSKTKSKKKIHK